MYLEIGKIEQTNINLNTFKPQTLPANSRDRRLWPSTEVKQLKK